MKNKSLIAIVAALVIVIAVAAIAYPRLVKKAEEEIPDTEFTTQQSQNESSQAAPDIRIYNKAGDPVTLSSFRGKPVIINFWATWCGFCIQEMPDFEEAYKKYGDEIQFLLVNTDDGIKKGEEFISDNGYTFPTFYDLEYDAAMTYGITGVPRTVAIDAEGNIVYNRSGMISAETLEGIIKMLR